MIHRLRSTEYVKEIIWLVMVRFSLLGEIKFHYPFFQHGEYKKNFAESLVIEIQSVRL